MIIRILLITIGSLLTLNTLFVSTISNINLGVIMPACIGAPLLILGIFYNTITAFFASNTFGAIIKWAMITVYGLFSVLFITTSLLITFAANTDPEPDADAIIVLGAGLREDRVSLTLKNRLDTAYDYITQNPETLCIVSGGMGPGETVTEAHAMKKYLVDLGISPERIIEEGESLSTYENFLFSKEIIAERLGHDASIVFVTTDFHVFRAELTAKTAGVYANGIAADSVWYITLNNYMRECAAIVQYVITGKI